MHRTFAGQVRLGAAVLLLALTGAAAASSIEQASGAQRVVSLIPSVTDLIVAMGAGDRLVGRTVYDTSAVLRTLPSVGQPMTPVCW